MDDHGSCRRLIGARCLVRRPIFQIETFRKLEVQLDGGTLERSAQCITDCDVDLWSIESTVSWVNVPLASVMFVERQLELLKMMNVSLADTTEW